MDMQNATTQTLSNSEWNLFRELFLSVADYMDSGCREADRSALHEAYDNLLKSPIGDAIYAEAVDAAAERWLGVPS